MDALARQLPESEERVNAWWESSNGFTNAVLTESYAKLTNACIHKPYENVHVFENRSGDESIRKRAEQLLQSKSFYYSRLVSERMPLSAKDVEVSRQSLLLLHPRQYSNIFHILEGTTLLLHLALHPERFPTIDTVVLSQHPHFPAASWVSLYEELLATLFPASRRPQFILAASDRAPRNLCSRVMLVGRAWETAGTGSFIGEPLGADLLRAAAYKRIGWKRHTGKRLVVLKRLQKRVIRNGDVLFARIQTAFQHEMNVSECVLERMNGAAQVALFVDADIVVGTHGAALTNVIFMLPSRYVIELFPPFWAFSCYKRLCLNMGVLYSKLTAKGEKGPECLKDESSLNCQYKGIRDRDFEIDPELVINEIHKAKRAVFRGST